MSRAIERAKTAPSAKKSDHEIKADGRCELDTQADTICAGKNCRMLSKTGGVCDVKGFHDDFDAIKDIPIARIATAYQDEQGSIYILIINEALYFGSSMDHLLINLNQIRHFGIPVLDDTYDSSRDLGIDHADVSSPFLTQGPTVFFETYAPSDEGLKSYPHIILTDREIE